MYNKLYVGVNETIVTRDTILKKLYTCEKCSYYTDILFTVVEDFGCNTISNH